MVGNTERGESNRKLRMSQSPSVSVICPGACEQKQTTSKWQHRPAVPPSLHHCQMCACFFLVHGKQKDNSVEV